MTASTPTMIPSNVVILQLRGSLNFASYAGTEKLIIIELDNVGMWTKPEAKGTTKSGSSSRRGRLLRCMTGKRLKKHKPTDGDTPNGNATPLNAKENVRVAISSGDGEAWGKDVGVGVIHSPLYSPLLLILPFCRPPRHQRRKTCSA